MDTLPVSYPCLPVSYPCLKNTSKTMLASVRYPTGPIQDIGHSRIARPDVRCGIKLGSRGLAAGRLLCPRQRTCSVGTAMSELCHEQTWSIAEVAKRKA